MYLRLDYSLFRLDAYKYWPHLFLTLRLFQTYLVSENLCIVECPSHHTKIISERCPASRLLFGPVLPLCPLATRSSLTPHNNQHQPACARLFTAVVFEHRVFFRVLAEEDVRLAASARRYRRRLHTLANVDFSRFTIHTSGKCVIVHNHRQCACSGVCGQLALDTPPATDTVLS